ncbi:MAG TPA: hypothetical protein VL495_01980 [Edaphobacter sp.]|jgi:hypothetical protein|nr:hypothetical protein [Edaphobacter sp.]
MNLFDLKLLTRSFLQGTKFQVVPSNSCHQEQIVTGSSGSEDSDLTNPISAWIPSTTTPKDATTTAPHANPKNNAL